MPINESPPSLPTLDWLQATYKTKSAKIRFLDSQGFTTNDIATHLGIRYQHVRNVLTTPLKRGPNEQFANINQPTED